MAHYSEVGMPTADVTHAEEATRFLSAVYLWMFIGLGVTSIASWTVSTTPALLRLIFSTPAVFYGLIIAELVVVIGLSWGINRISGAVATILFLLYSALNGATLSAIFIVYAQESILRAFIAAACLFAAMSIYGYFTKRDLTSLGNIMFVGLIAVVVMSLLNLFLFKSSGFDYLISIVGILVFLGLTAYDTQKILRGGRAAIAAGGELLRKATIIGALALYLDFINLFLYLLRLFGKRR